MRVFETSAKTGAGVHELFSCCAKELYLNRRENKENNLEEEEIQPIPLDEKKLKVKKRKCC